MSSIFQYKIYTLFSLVTFLLPGCFSNKNTVDCPFGTSYREQIDGELTIRSCARIIDDQEVAHGPRKMWIRGTLVSHQNFQKNRLHGKDQHWYENGAKKSLGQHKEGKKDGEWTYWYKSGNKLKNETYSLGKPEGLWITWYKDGKSKKEEIHFENGRKIKSISYNKNGEIIQPLSSKPTPTIPPFEGEKTKFDRYGNISAKGNYVQGKKDGIWTEYYAPYGTIKSGTHKAKEITFSEGKKEGPASFFFPNGSLREKGSYSNDKRDGIWTSYIAGHEVKDMYKNGKYLHPIFDGNAKIHYFINSIATANNSTYKLTASPPDNSFPAKIICSSPDGASNFELNIEKPGLLMISPEKSFILVHRNKPIIVIEQGYGNEFGHHYSYEIFTLKESTAKHLYSMTTSTSREEALDQEGANMLIHKMNLAILSINQSEKGIIINTKRNDCEDSNCSVTKEDYLLTHDGLKLKNKEVLLKR